MNSLPLLVSAILINNFVLVQFLGLCPFMGVSISLKQPLVCLSNDINLTLASVCSYITYNYLLLPLELTYLRTIAFILDRSSGSVYRDGGQENQPLLYKVLGILPLITTNCAVLGSLTQH